MKFKNVGILWFFTHIEYLLLLISIGTFAISSVRNNDISCILLVVLITASISTIIYEHIFDEGLAVKRPWFAYKSAKNEIKTRKYIALSFDTFVSIYKLMCYREKEINKANPFATNYRYPFYNETMIVFSDALDYIRFIKFLRTEAEQEERNNIKSNYDIKALAEISDDFENEKKRQMSKYNNLYQELKVGER